MTEHVEYNLKEELEIQLEKEKLNEVVSIINEEIEKVLKHRKNFLDQLLQYRKKFIEEYREDEDRGIEYFDHERFISEEAFNSMDKKLKTLNNLKLSPYFGRIDFREEEYGIENLYIGRFGLVREGDYAPVVVDWRSPVASLFYEGKIGTAKYKVGTEEVDVSILKRIQYIIKNSKLIGMFNSEVDIKDEILQMVLSSNSKDKLQDIVRTIQKEQDEIIRTTPYTTAIVDGVAGSGKTTIALHRIAYLLYNYRKSLENKVLILGPNEIFMEYISEVLPTLGETAVKQSTFKEFALSILDLKEEYVMSYDIYMELILNKDKEFMNKVSYKTSKEYIKALEQYLQKLNKDFCRAEDVYLMDYKVITKEEIEELFKVYYKDMPLFRRNKKIKRIIIEKLKDRRDDLVREINKKYKEIKESLTVDQLILEENNLDYKRKIEIREIIQNLMIVKKSLEFLDGEDIKKLYENFNGNDVLTIDDLAPMLYLKYNLEGYKYEDEIKHVVIDEAQDFSELQFRVIKLITKPSAMTILGDCNQRLVPMTDHIPLRDLGSIYDFKDMKNFKLDTSYRSTKEIMEYANKFLDGNNIIPLVRSGDPVEEKSVKEFSNLIELIKDRIYRAKEKEYDTVGIICETLEQCKEVYDNLKDKVNVKLIDKEESIYRGGIVILPTYFAKGLEFDNVIAIFNDKFKDEKYIRYVTATRALHKLNVINYI